MRFEPPADLRDVRRHLPAGVAALAVGRHRRRRGPPTAVIRLLDLIVPAAQVTGYQAVESGNDRGDVLALVIADAPPADRREGARSGPRRCRTRSVALPSRVPAATGSRPEGVTDTDPCRVPGVVAGDVDAELEDQGEVLAAEGGAFARPPGRTARSPRGRRGSTAATTVLMRSKSSWNPVSARRDSGARDHPEVEVDVRVDTEEQILQDQLPAGPGALEREPPGPAEGTAGPKGVIGREVAVREERVEAAHARVVVELAALDRCLHSERDLAIERGEVPDLVAASRRIGDDRGETCRARRRSLSPWRHPRGKRTPTSALRGGFVLPAAAVQDRLGVAVGLLGAEQDRVPSRPGRRCWCRSPGPAAGRPGRRRSGGPPPAPSAAGCSITCVLR